MSDEKQVPITLIVPLLEAGPILFQGITSLMDMFQETKEAIENWDSKTAEERKALLEEASERFDRSISEWDAALAAVKAK